MLIYWVEIRLVLCYISPFLNNSKICSEKGDMQKWVVFEFQIDFEPEDVHKISNIYIFPDSLNTELSNGVSIMDAGLIF